MRTVASLLPPPPPPGQKAKPTEIVAVEGDNIPAFIHN